MYGGAERTYGEVDVRANRLANALLATGLGPGDRVAVWSEDAVEYLETYMAAARAGLAVVPVNSRFTVSEAQQLIEDAGATTLLFSDNIAPRIDVGFDASDFRTVVAFGSQRVLRAQRFEDLIEGGSPEVPPAPADDDIFIIAYTSGTTGVPKGAMLTHRSVRAVARNHAITYRLPLGSVAAYTGSMSFVATVCAFAMSHLQVGGTLRLLGGWDTERALRLISEYDANFVYVPSPVADEFGEAVRDRPDLLDSLITVLHSASKLSPEKLERLAEAVGPRLLEGWGMTENSGGLCTATTAADIARGNDAMDFFASVGRATVESDVEVLEADGTPLPHDGVSEGELAVRSSALMAGYWNNPVATAAAFANGQYRTGDIGRIDPAGYVYISERRSDLIISGGMNVYPSEVEQVIALMPGVRECAVIGLPHERWGQTVVAVIVPERDSAPAEDAVITHCLERLASYKKPTRVVFVSELPKTISEKLRRGEVRERLMRGDVV